MNKLLSLIVPTYNCEEYIEETTDYILTVLPDNCELVLVDDGSTDSTPKVLKKYESEVNRVKISLREHGGVSKARNAGIDLSSGKWIAFMDCDDCLTKNYFSEGLALLDDDTDLYIFGFEWVELHRNASSDKESVTEEIVSCLTLNDRVYESASDFADDYIRRRNLLVYSSCNKFYKKSLIDKYGFRYTEGLSFGEDRLFNYDYLMQTRRIVTSQLILFKYIQRNPDSATKRTIPHYFDIVMRLHHAKMDCILNLSHGVSLEDKRTYAGADLSKEMEHLIDRFEEHPEEKEENLSKVNELIFDKPDDLSGRFDVIIVLGSVNCGYRLKRAYDIACKDPDTYILVTGGNVHGDGKHIEAEYMAECLRSFGFSEERILIENKAENTYKNLELSIELVEKNIDKKNPRIGIVTAAFHVARTRQTVNNVSWYRDKDVVFVPAYGPSTSPDNWFTNPTGRGLCLGEIEKCYRIKEVEGVVLYE
ncbi:MAG: glycosyltransferase [Lachnospiraceae bacterium]|nr:glycosyltransferase [Lachnospiraceae bacterium]